jgi:hypothetical protein
VAGREYVELRGFVDIDVSGTSFARAQGTSLTANAMDGNAPLTCSGQGAMLYYGACVCEDGWKGATCAEVDLSSGYVKTDFTDFNGVYSQSPPATAGSTNAIANVADSSAGTTDDPTDVVIDAQWVLSSAGSMDRFLFRFKMHPTQCEQNACNYRWVVAFSLPTEDGVAGMIVQQPDGAGSFVQMSIPAPYAYIDVVGTDSFPLNSWTLVLKSVDLRMDPHSGLESVGVPLHTASESDVYSSRRRLLGISWTSSVGAAEAHGAFVTTQSSSVSLGCFSAGCSRKCQTKF